MIESVDIQDMIHMGCRMSHVVACVSAVSSASALTRCVQILDHDPLNAAFSQESILLSSSSTNPTFQSLDHYSVGMACSSD